MTPSRVRVLIAHSEPLLSAGLESALRCQAEMEIVTATDAFQSYFDVALADCDTGVQLARAGCTGNHRVVIVTSDESEISIRRALEAGVRGYLLLDATPESVVQTVRRVMNGGTVFDPKAATRMLESLGHSQITKRELDVLRLLTVGLSDKAIARHLGIGVQTSKSHVRRILAKLEAGSRTQAAAIAQRRGLVPAPY
jgi:DNA-binding NarL/FixJ family response regulator